MRHKIITRWFLLLCWTNYYHLISFCSFLSNLIICSFSLLFFLRWFLYWISFAESKIKHANDLAEQKKVKTKKTAYSRTNEYFFCFFVFALCYIFLWIASRLFDLHCTVMQNKFFFFVGSCRVVVRLSTLSSHSKRML